MDTLRNNYWFFICFTLLICVSRAGAESSCLDCHSVLDPPFQVTEQQFSLDIHQQKGLTCASCHGGDPSKADDSAMAKSAGFRGHIKRTDIPTLCAHCHADAAYM